MRVEPKNIHSVRTANQHSSGTMFILRRRDGSLCMQLCNPLSNNFSKVVCFIRLLIKQILLLLSLFKII
jgi:hypothetical protein